MLSKLVNRILWLYKPAPPKRSPFTPNPQEFLLIIIAVIIGVAFQVLAPVIFAKIKRFWKFELNRFCDDRGHNLFDFHVPRKIATESYNARIADCNYEKGSEDDAVKEIYSRSGTRKLKSKKSGHNSRSR